MSTNNKPNYRIYDCTGGGVTHDIYAASLDEAIDAGREWIEDGDWASEDGVIRKGVTLDACVRPITTDEDGEDITDDQQENDCSGSYSDEEPECESEGPGDDDGGHDWRSPYSLLGGLRENPGVWSRGGTVTVTKSVCACCGKYRTETDAGSQLDSGEPKSVVEYEDANEDSEAWLVLIHEEDGWIPQWLAEQLDRPPTTRYTEEQAKEYVAEHTDDDDLDEDDLEHVFAALNRRRATDQERAEGLWSHCCAAA